MPLSSRYHRYCLFSTIVLALSCRAQNLYVQTSDPRIQYSPEWKLTEGNASHITNTAGATAAFSFEGTYVALRSTRSSTHGIEMLLLDGVEHVVNCSWQDASVSGNTVIVFEQDNLSPSAHSVTFVKYSPPELVAVVWDFLYRPLTAAEAISASSSGTAPRSSVASSVESASAALQTSASTDSSKSGVSGATIGAAVGASVLFLIFLALMAWYIIRRRRHLRSVIRNQASQNPGDDSEAEFPKEDPSMMHSQHLPVDFAIQAKRQHMRPPNLYIATSMDDTASVMSEDALSPAQQYAEQTRGQSLATMTDDTGSIAPSSRARSYRDKPPTYVTSRTPTQGNLQISKLAELSNTDIPGGVLLEEPSTSAQHAFEDRKRRAVQDTKLSHLVEEDVPGAVMVEAPSPSLSNGFGTRRKRSVQDDKFAHLMETDAPGAVMLEDPSPSLGHGFTQKG